MKDSNILLLGITFKENCPDIRNTKVVDIYSTLLEYTKNISVYDPWANAEKVYEEYGIRMIDNINEKNTMLSYWRLDIMSLKQLI